VALSEGTGVSVGSARGACAMASTRQSPLPSHLDAESRAWIESLSSQGRDREEAIARLHALLLRAARFEVARRRATMPQLAGVDLADMALQSADDALVAVLSKLQDFRGASRFTTWAYKFAVLEAAVKARRRPWQNRELPLEGDIWPDPGGDGRSPQAAVERSELLEAVRDAMHAELTPHQREVLVAVALNDVPIDVLAERLGTTRGALYKTIHDARAKLRRKLEAGGPSIELAAEGGQR